MTTLNLELQLAPHKHNYVLYVHTSLRVFGDIRLTWPMVFDKNRQFNLNSSPWSKQFLNLKNNYDQYKSIIKSTYKYGTQLKDNPHSLSTANIQNPWNLNGFFQKGVGLGYPELNYNVFKDLNGYLMDNIVAYGTGQEKICFVKAKKQVEFAENYLKQHSKVNPKIVRIVVTNKIDKDTIGIFPYRAGRFNYDPCYENPDLNKDIFLPAVIDFPEKLITESEVIRNDIKNPTANELIKAGENLGVTVSRAESANKSN